MGKQSDAAMRDLQATVERATKMLTLEIDANLREATPKLTGHAAANWVPSVSAPAAVVADGADGSVHDAGVAQVLKFKLADGAAFVTNNVDYVPPLNLGHSTKAPIGFVEQAIADAEATVQAKFDSLQIEIGAEAYQELSEAYAPVQPIAAFTPRLPAAIARTRSSKR